MMAPLPSNNNGEDPGLVDSQKQRNQCHFCPQVTFDANKHENNLVPCNIQAFSGKSFRVWRCDQCRSLHCLDVVNLDYYYSKYPFVKAVLNLPMKLAYRNLWSRFPNFAKHHKFLDYGCSNGLFVRYLRECRGHTNAWGYDPYSSREEFRDKTRLEENAPYDYILLQDVLEHVEVPADLLQELVRLLKPGGYLLVGTPNADAIQLQKTGVMEFRNELHAPYHLHIPTRRVVEQQAIAVGLVPVRHFAGGYGEVGIGLNGRCIKYYQYLRTGCLDCLFEPLQVLIVLMSPMAMFWALFGYLFPYKSDMANLLYKPNHGERVNREETKKKD